MHPRSYLNSNVKHFQIQRERKILLKLTAGPLEKNPYSGNSSAIILSNEYFLLNHILSDFGSGHEKCLNLGFAICIHLWWYVLELAWNTVVRVKSLGVSRWEVWSVLTAANFPARGPACKMVIRIAHLYSGNALMQARQGPVPSWEGRWTWEQTSAG